MSRSIRKVRGHHRASSYDRGFTLIELLVVIAIIAALAAVVAPSLFRNVGDAKSTAAKAQLEVFALALLQYRIDNDGFPSSEEGLEALRTAPATLEGESRWRGPYLTRPVPHDPWGQAYRYASPGTRDTLGYDLYTLGRDRRLGGQGEDADITSWDAPSARPASSANAREL